MTKELNTIVCRFVVFKIVHCQTMIDQAFAIVLRRLRTEKGLSQEKFGFFIDCTLRSHIVCRSCPFDPRVGKGPGQSLVGLRGRI